MILVDQLKKILEEHPTSNVQLLLCKFSKFPPILIFKLIFHEFFSYDILGGDFNSLPESGVIEYIENGEISKSMLFVMSLIKIIS